MSASETVWRFSLAMMCADPHADLTRPERAWLVARVQEPTLFPADARAAWLPRLLAYADARSPALGVSLRQTLGLTARPVVPGADALGLLATYPGTAAREEAAVLADVSRSMTDPHPIPKGSLL